MVGVKQSPGSEARIANPRRGPTPEIGHSERGSKRPTHPRCRGAAGCRGRCIVACQPVAATGARAVPGPRHADRHRRVGVDRFRELSACPAQRSTPLPATLARTLEVESGLNDPIAVLLVLVGINVIRASSYSALDAGTFIAEEVGVGALVGVGIGWIASMALKG